jgi:superfamily II DNA or RNA helicase
MQTSIFPVEQILLKDVDFNLYDYQDRMVKAVYKLIRSGDKRIMCQLATGGGKSRVIAKICYDALSRKRRVLIIAHREELVKQLLNHISFITSPLNIGIIKAGYEFHPECMIQIASIQTLQNRWDLIPYLFDVIIVDEGHHGVAESYQEVYRRHQDAVILWFTATPERADGEGFEDICQAIVTGDSLGASVAELIAQKKLRDFDVYAPDRTVDLSAIQTKGNDYDLALLSEKSRDPVLVADAPKMWSQYCKGRRTAVFTVDVAHSLAVVDEYRKAGIWAEEINAKTPKPERRDKISRFIRGEYLVLVNIGIFTEGFDLNTFAELEGLPEAAIDAVQFLRATQSLSLYLQMAGRGLRQSKDFEKCIFLDHAGVTDEFGDPDFPFKWGLQGAMKDCPSCEKEVRTKIMICPHCSYDFTKPQEEQDQEDLDSVKELVEKNEIDHDKAKDLVLKKRDLMSQFLRFQSIAESEGKSRGWIWFKIKLIAKTYGELFAISQLLGYQSYYTFTQWIEINESKDSSWMPTFDELEEVRKTLKKKDGGAYHGNWTRRQLGIMEEHRMNGLSLLGKKNEQR